MIAGRDTGHRLAHGLDDPRALVAEDRREDEREGPADDGKIGVADAARDDAYDHLVRARLEEHDLADHEPFAGCLEHRGACGPACRRALPPSGLPSGLPSPTAPTVSLTVMPPLPRAPGPCPSHAPNAGSGRAARLSARRDGPPRCRSRARARSLGSGVEPAGARPGRSARVRSGPWPTVSGSITTMSAHQPSPIRPRSRSPYSGPGQSESRAPPPR